MSNSKEDGPKVMTKWAIGNLFVVKKPEEIKHALQSLSCGEKGGVLLRVLYTNVLFIHVNLQPNLLSVELGPGHLNTTLSRRQD